MGLKMIERNTNVFYEEDVKEVGLKVREVCVLSGMCTELPNGANGRRVFAFIHYTVQVKYYIIGCMLTLQCCIGVEWLITFYRRRKALKAFFQNIFWTYSTMQKS